MDEVVELKRIDLATIESREPVADALEQLAQVLLVVFADDLACGAPPRALCASTSVRVVTAHGPHATPKSTIVATQQLPVPRRPAATSASGEPPGHPVRTVGQRLSPTATTGGRTCTRVRQRLRVCGS